MGKGVSDGRLRQVVDVSAIERSYPVESAFAVPNASHFVGGPAIARYVLSAEITSSTLGAAPFVILNALISSDDPGIPNVVPREGMNVDWIKAAIRHDDITNAQVPHLQFEMVSSAVTSPARAAMPVGGLTIDTLRPSPMGDANRRCELGTGISSPVSIDAVLPFTGVAGIPQGYLADTFWGLDWYIPPGAALRIFSSQLATATDDSRLVIAIGVTESESKEEVRQGWPLG